MARSLNGEESCHHVISQDHVMMAALWVHSPTFIIVDLETSRTLWAQETVPPEPARPLIYRLKEPCTGLFSFGVRLGGEGRGAPP